LGWTVIILWECELEISTRESILTMLANSLSKGTTIKSQL
jgi:G:T-mismatch repair DNA endonuclease (very short patch repair protein)